MNSKENNKSGHRERLKSKIIKNINSNYAYEYLQDYEILEYLLFNVIPRKDTKPIAKELLSNFNNLNNVFNEDLEKLQQIKGISKNSALAIKSQRNIINKYIINSLLGIEYNLEMNVGQLRLIYYGLKKEILIAIMLDKKNKINAFSFLEKGIETAVEFNKIKILETCNKYKSKKLILSHNHHEEAIPSNEDIRHTNIVKNFLKINGIDLFDHLIVADNDFYSFKLNGKL